ncbi:MAG: hypothetical protein GIW95_02190 [Candidatus Eremiobacteraeota bacterium]|nr:hypothetical protein [Candidatus Eremiobacteraeota bacterium]
MNLPLRPAALFAAVAVCGGIARAADAPSLPSLRHLVFTANISMLDAFEKQLDNIPHSSSAVTTSRNGGSVRSGPDMGNVTARSKTRTAAKTQIVCDIVAATPDAGLVVDIREDGSERRAPSARVAVLANGRLSYAPEAVVNPEEVAVLQLLARGVVGAQAHDVGASWTISDDGTDYRSKMVFRVTGASAPDTVRLDLDQEFRSGGAHSYGGTLHGKLEYDPTKLVPRKAALESKTRIQTADSYRVVDLTIDLALVEDSFGKL